MTTLNVTQKPKSITFCSFVLKFVRQTSFVIVFCDMICCLNFRVSRKILKIVLMSEDSGERFHFELVVLIMFNVIDERKIAVLLSMVFIKLSVRRRVKKILSQFLS